MSSYGYQTNPDDTPISSERASADRPPTTQPEASGREAANNRSTFDDQCPFLSVVLPAYNEAESIEDTVKMVRESASEVCDSYEIIVIDDGSDDTTDEELLDVTAEIPATRFIQKDVNRGKGCAIRDGCQGAIGEYVLFLDADGEITPASVKDFVERAEETGADIVIGSKRHPDSDVTYPLKRRVLSKGYSLLIQLLFGLHVTDTQVGMKLLHRDAVREVMPLLLVERYAFDVELLALLHEHGFTIAEAPVSLDFNGNSSIDWKEVGRIGWDTLSVFSRLKILASYEKMEHGIDYARERHPVLQKERHR